MVYPFLLEVIPETNVTSRSEEAQSSHKLATDNSPQATNILVVEDYADNLDLILFMLDSHGYQTDSVNNGKEGCRQIGRAKLRPSFNGLSNARYGRLSGNSGNSGERTGATVVLQLLDSPPTPCQAIVKSVLMQVWMTISVSRLILGSSFKLFKNGLRSLFY